ncbi:type II CRISPR RNA-guided endonuclease Cas9 [Formosa sp. PL04]|uniref:type II CRISPR RNA-guided endonuclease Cas9 n=1 Tax=Formosa sp. PL04 TaxID=3081755 RepID=UPI002981949B|nr:type II CRISPR RNA-guided endonuclease Cas9 [Formosa sp. PL04]MDW5287196.1 HNH endonuclease domain-containing protein [Formosa sp. PL04]
MKRVLGLDLGTNSIGWSLVQSDFKNKTGNIEGLGVRIIPMSQDVLGKFDAGQSISQTAERTGYRGVRRLYQRDNLRRERLHRVLHVLGFLPEHYAESIDFETKLGQFKPESEEKINYKKNDLDIHEFLFKDSFSEMVKDFKFKQPQLFYENKKGEETKIPYDWTLYFLRKKALSDALTKEELAWIILNFNQKRGYYQLRGEDVDEDKNKQFVQLKVKEVIDSGQSVKGNTLYNVVFENGWPYDKQITKTEDWLERTKEFIVTISTLKNGDTKYSYKAVDSENDWVAIKAKTEQDVERSGKTVGEYIYGTLLLNPTQKIRGKLVKTIERKFYKNEFKKILSKQIELQPELFSNGLYEACVSELYPRNEAHQNNIKDKGFEYLFTDDIIFYQRPLKSNKSNISGCQFETRNYIRKNKETGGLEEVKEPVKAISRSHPLFQEFRLWQWLQNLRIYKKEKVEIDITGTLLKSETDWTDLYDFLTTKQAVEQKHIIDYFIKNKLLNKAEKESYRWNYVEDKKYPCCETKAQFVSRLNKTIGITNASEFLEKENVEEQLWHIIYSVTDINEYEKALRKFAKKQSIDEASFVVNFIKFPPFASDYGSFSKKAIDRLLPVMRMGKYWNVDMIPPKAKDRSADIMDRVNQLKLKEDFSSKDLTEALQSVSDDDVPKQLIKSFVSFKGKNSLTGLNTYQACYLVYGRHSEIGDIQQWKSPSDIERYLETFKQHSLRNPIVEQVVTETLRVVHDIWKFYGDGSEDFFDEIHVELGREMKNPADKRKMMSQKVSENENTNYRIKEVLKDLMTDPMVDGDVRSFSPSHQELLKIFEEGVYQNPNAKYDSVSEDEIQKIRRNTSPSKNDITRYKLWLEQGYISPYTGKPIQLSKLFTTDYQIEHIIPQSRYFDNSLSNKIICESVVNEDKDNKTAYEYLKEKGGSLIDGHKLLKIDEYEAHVGRYFKSNRTKLKNLLSEDIPEGFINRQLNDSRYISKLIKGLLSNIVREDNEKEATSKHIVPVTGVITNKLKNDWGLNDKWNEIIAPRFKRLNTLTDSEDFGFWDKNINAFRIQVPDEISKGFSKKRIDHRHHALDALVIACTSKDHINYLSALNAEKKNYGLRDKLLMKNNNGHYTKNFQMPWGDYPVEVKKAIEETVVSFKQNTRVINKTNNKFWSYKDENGNLNLGKDGKPKKILRKQTKGDNWAIRKPLHKETVSGIYETKTPKGKVATSVRGALSDIKNEKHLAKITDSQIRDVILPNHLKNYIDDKGEPQFAIAFSEEGVEDLNKNIVQLNNGKKHQPINKVKFFEIGTKFPVGENGNKSSKYVEAAKGTNLFFAVYWDEKKKKRNFETIPLNEVVAHQKQVAHLPKEDRTPIQSNPEKGKFLFTLSPNDLVYVPTEDELESPQLVNFKKLNNERVTRIYKMVSTTQDKLECVPVHYAAPIKINEMGSNNKSQNTIFGTQIKSECWKLKVDRLGNISKA